MLRVGHGSHIFKSLLLVCLNLSEDYLKVLYLFVYCVSIRLVACDINKLKRQTNRGVNQVVVLT